MQRKKIENAIANLPNEMKVSMLVLVLVLVLVFSPMTKDAAAERARRRR
jgi:hypothetical protein